ncbi:alpha-hydroxy acid oxidase [Marinomonas algicola]|uniref:alpha-hydroxy acid oxidase n=1 Tax=Marinomonas algicola TaxID=2773454 RepID=UPI00174A09FE|nr:alpha-hydroxy acid oxidase [Marinomonas algicola]
MQKNQKIYPPLNHIPADILCAQDYERLASSFIPLDRLAYISGGSGDETTLVENCRSFSEFSIIPRSLKDVSKGHTGLNIMGKDFVHPVLLAPVAHQALVHPEAERATAYAAEATDSCMIASTLSSFTLEDIAGNSSHRNWFQIYFQPNDEDTLSLMKRAINAGYHCIVLTVDASIQVPSVRALQAKFSFPEHVKAANIIHQTVQEKPNLQSGQSHIFQHYMQTAATRERVKKLIEASDIPVVVKGVMSEDDAMEYCALGAAGIIVSNHGGRTLDGVPSSLSVLSKIRRAVGTDYPLLFDSGIRSGRDVFKAIALGADAVLIGRLQIYALSVAGALGVAHMVKLLREELELCMAMTGCSSIDEIKKTKLHKKMEKL